MILALTLCLFVGLSTAFAADELIVDRVIVELADDSGLIFGDASVIDRGTLAADSRAARDMNAFFVDKRDVHRVSRLFTASIAELDANRRSAEARSGKPSPDLNRFGLISYAGAGHSLETLEEICRDLMQDPRIADAHPDYLVDVQIRTARTGAGGDRSTTPDFVDYQGYRGAAPEGLNSDAVWNIPGARGDNVSFIDIELGWWLDHEDLPTAFYEHYFNDPLGFYHGTAVLGEIVAQDNGYGMLGMTPNAEFGVINAHWVSYCDNAIAMAASQLDPGDVYIIELHYNATDIGWVPMEWFSDVRAAIYQNTQNGYICVEAAGNGHNDLDIELPDFVRYSATDCGAIMVGSTYPNGDVTSHTNYGTRLDANGWGCYVATCGGYGDLYGDVEIDHTTAYTNTFSGTSSATPMVAGAVISLQSMYIEKYGAPLSPLEMRDLITATGSPQTPDVKNVGSRPDILEAWEIVSDDYAPEAIDDLGVISKTSTRIRLYWHAPLEMYLDQQIQPVAEYDIRYSTSPINAGNFDSAARAEFNCPFIGTSGTLQYTDVFDLQPSTTYYFAVKSIDRAEQVSPLSDITSDTTLAPEPDLEISFSDFMNPVFLGTEVDVEIVLANTGSLDLNLNSFALLYNGLTDFSINPFTPNTLAPGQTYTLNCSGKPTASGDNWVVFTVGSNDPQGAQNGSFDLECLETPTIDATVCEEGTVNVSATLSNIGDSEITWRYAWTSDSPHGPAGDAPQSHYDRYMRLIGTSFAIDGAHAATLPGDLADFAYYVTQHGASLDTLAAITPATLAGIDALVIPGMETGWTAAERTALADWVVDGGSVYLEAAPSAIMQTEMNALLSALGSGTTIVLDPTNPPPLYTFTFGEHPLMWGVEVMFLATNDYSDYDAVELNVGAGDVELASSLDGTDVKVACGEAGKGRYAVIGGPILRDTVHTMAGNADFLANLSRWAVDRSDRIDAMDYSGTISAGQSAEIEFEVDAEGIPSGEYEFFIALDVDLPETTSCLIPVTLEVHASTLAIQSLAAEALYLNDDCGKSVLTWTTTEPATCTVEWGLNGGPLDNTTTTPLGTNHSVTLPTVMRQKYDALITADSPTCGVPVDDTITWKTTQYCLGGPPLLDELQTPLATELVGAMPNPFNPLTTINFNLAARGHVELSIYDVQGRRVTTLLNEVMDAGRYQETWTGRNDENRRVSSGVYFAVFKAGETRDTSRLVLLK